MRPEKGKSRDLKWLALLTLALVLVALGVWRQEVTVLWHKAIRICWECMGIG